MRGKWIDLHCHLDGSLDPETTFRLAKQRHLISDEITIDKFMPWANVEDKNFQLYDYLKLFELPTALLKDREAIFESTKAVIKNLSINNNLYTELRFAPQYHVGPILDFDDVVQIVIDATKQAEQEYNTKVNLLLCMIVGAEDELNKKTIETAAKFLGNKVVGIDIAGPEGLMPMKEYAQLFKYAKSLGIPFTIHAGEIGPASNVHEAISFGAKRIGHGGNIITNPEVIKEVIENGITLEMCPSSNVQCHNQPSYKEHVIRKLYDLGVHTTINTDNRTISKTTTINEVGLVKQYLDFTNEDIDKMMHYAIDAAFISQEEKEELHKAYKEN